MEPLQSSRSIESAVGLPNDESQPDLEQGRRREGSVRSRRQGFARQYEQRNLYNWTEYAPVPRKNPLNFLKWIVQGVSPKKETDEALQQNLCGVARLLILLREYQDRFGIPELGGPRDQEFVLQDICIELYQGGAPIWALEPVMKKVAEGLTGQRGVDFFFLPRKAFIFAPTSGATSMFEWNRGFRISRLESMEKVAVRLASFASNTNSTSSLPSRMPHVSELRNAYRDESASDLNGSDEDWTRDELAEEILDLASESEGLFFFLNTNNSNKASTVSLQSLANGSLTNGEPRHLNGSVGLEEAPAIDSFWVVNDNTRELFSRLATLEAIQSVDRIESDTSVLYPFYIQWFFRIASSAGACAIWFNGSWWDMLVAGVLAVVVALVGSSTFLSRHDRLIFEVIASFIVGFVSGMIALRWPEDTCFGAMAIAGVLDILQGFRVVYAIIEIMSKHTVTGGADFLEGILFTGLIAYSLTFGQYIASSLKLDDPTNAVYPDCTHGISEWWYFLFVPLAAFSWSGLFDPDYIDLPMMGFHGVLAYTVSWAIDRGSLSGNFNNFMAAMTVTFSAGLVSRFTGRQALGNTISGLYVLLPGAYLVNEVFANQMSGFLEGIILRAITIGLGSWTGTLLCSPTLFGTNRGQLQQQSGLSSSSGRHTRRRKPEKGAMLFF